VGFDDDGSPWYTVCSIEAGDRPGLLHAFAQAFATSGVDVHSARIGTSAGRVCDVFELTDRRGRKLAERTKQAVRDAVAAGGRPVTPRLRVPRRPATFQPPVPAQET
jgi:[protein-PII] uridylyltransferase